MSEEMKEYRERLLALLRATLRQGKITLTSGRITDFYIDGRQVTLNPEGLALASRPSKWRS